MAVKASRLQSAKIKATSVYVTAKACLGAIHAGHYETLPQYTADEHIKDWAKQFLDVVQAKIYVKNPYNVTLSANQRYIVMCNHTSLFDIPLGYIAFPDVSLRMLAKKELTKIPIFGRAMSVLGTPTIDRHNREQAVKDLEKTKVLMESGMVLWMAPEGTRSKSGALRPFKKGGFITAIEASATIIPLVIKGANKICPGDNSRIYLNQPVSLTIGKPIDASAYSLENKEELISSLHTQMAKLLSTGSDC
jgi:1-acyl-sn-glycerol-3-phosphate acyltransferase